MYKHESKVCPRCGQVFECRVGDVLKCQCYGISFSEILKRNISDKYQECLCRNCLLELGGIIETESLKENESVRD